MKKWFVYLLECNDGSFYCGISTDIDKRIEAHSTGKGSKYVDRKGFRRLIGFKECSDRSEASKEEYKIKQLSHNEKLDYFKEEVLKCVECGVCCKLFLINLTEKEYNSERYKSQFREFGLIEDFAKAEECGANIIEQKDDGSCIYLEDGKCSIHNDRPDACKDFFCDSKDEKFQGMIEDINNVKTKL